MMDILRFTKITLLAPDIGNGYCLERFELTFQKCTIKDGFKFIDHTNKQKVRVEVDTWYRNDKSVANEIRDTIAKRYNISIQNYEEFVKAIECRSFYCDYL